MTSREGFTLAEILIVSLITGFLTLASFDMMANYFKAESSLNRHIEAKELKNSLSERIFTIAKEGTKPYYNSLTITIPVNNSSYSVKAEQDTLAVLIPKFDANGNVIQPSTGITTFKGVAYSLISKNIAVNGSQGGDEYVLLETNTEFNLNVNSSDPLTIIQNLPTDWTNGTSQIIADNLKPGIFKNLNSTPFDVEGNMVSFAFVPQDGYVYFPSIHGSKNIDDSKYLSSCQFRNFRT